LPAPLLITALKYATGASAPVFICGLLVNAVLTLGCRSQPGELLQLAPHSSQQAGFFPARKECSMAQLILYSANAILITALSLAAILAAIRDRGSAMQKVPVKAKHRRPIR